MVQTTRDRPQQAMLRKSSGVGNYGRPTFETVKEVSVRWEEVNRQIIDNNGDRVAVDATVMVGEEVPVDSELWKGTLEHDSTPADGKLYEVIAYEEIPDLKGRTLERTVLLRRKSDTVGDVA